MPDYNALRRATRLGESLEALRHLAELVPEDENSSGLKHLLEIIDDKLEAQFTDMFESICELSKQADLIIPNQSAQLMTVVHPQ